MTKIALIAAAIKPSSVDMIKNAMNAAAFLVGLGIAFVGDSHSANNLNQRSASVDTMITTSISKPHMPVRRPMPLGIERGVFSL